MAQNSNIRRIDELGRIVIPKDIRKKMHMKENEPLEIFMDNGEIIIKKYSYLPDIIEYVKYIVDIGSRITNNKYIITDRDNIIASTNKKLVDCPINEYFEKLVLSCTDEKNFSLNTVIADESIKGYANIIPLIIDNDRAGIIVEYNEHPIENQYIIKIFKSLIEERLSNY